MTWLAQGTWLVVKGARVTLGVLSEHVEKTREGETQNNSRILVSKYRFLF